MKALRRGLVRARIRWRDTSFYWLYGFWVRREACRFAAIAVQGPWSKDHNTAHLIWSLSVFFEKYMIEGASNTQDDFGPKEPAQLGLIQSPRSKP